MEVKMLHKPRITKAVNKTRKRIVELLEGKRCYYKVPKVVSKYK